MKRNHFFLFLIFLFVVIAEEETKNDEADQLSLHALWPFQQCVSTASCHLCTSQNMVLYSMVDDDGRQSQLASQRDIS